MMMDSEDSGGGTGGDTSTYQVLAAQDSYPKQICQFDEPSLSIPFIPLSGEYAQFVGRTSDGLIALSNYRVFLQQRDATYHIPLGVIEIVECREIFFLYLLSKDTKSYKCTFPTNEQCAEWQRRLTKALALPQRLENVFAFAFYMWNMEEARDLHNALVEPEGQQSYAVRAEKMFDEEVRRLGFDLGGAWRISVANSEYQLCPTYPKKLVVPASINDNVLDFVARFRAARRIPAVVWRHSNGAVIARCSQPEVGWLGWRSSEDEDLVKAISEACAYDSPVTPCSGIIGTTPSQLVPPSDGDKEALTPSSDIPSLCDLPEAKAQADIKKVLIVDARSYATAVANRARGGGCECPEYYPQCEIQFMNLANIHTIRKSHYALRQLASSSPDIPNWLSLLENSRWLGHLSGLFKAAVTIVQAVEREARPVLVHCSDGWDRTPQLTALSQLLLDPYYRTIHGFVVLIEREWVEFGHKFSDRCGIGRCCEDVNERCPVFLQWLDCVHHLLYWYPTAFQFNQAFLVKLAQHVYSNLFGTFLCNSSQERVQADIGDRSYSVWSFFKVNSQRYTNYLYAPTQQVLYPSCHIKDLRLWTSVYMPEMGEVTADPSTSTHPSVGDDEDEEEEIAGGGGELVKTKSYDDLLAGTSPPSHQPFRRSSDPNIRESGPNMAMLNSALGAELGNDETDAADENANEDAASEEYDAYEDSTSEPIGERQNDESESLTLCEPSVSESDIHDGVSIVQNEPCDSVESGEEANELLGQECVELEEKCITKVTDSKRELVNGTLHNRDGVNIGRQFKSLAEQSIEGSTDTLVAEIGIIATEEKVSQDKISEHLPILNRDSGQNSPKSILQGKCCPFMNGLVGGEENEVCSTSSSRRGQKQSVSSNSENSVEDRTEKRTVNGVPNMSSVMHSVAASGCNICLQSKKLLDETSAGDSWRSAGLMNETNMNGGTVRGVTTGPGGRVSLYSTPMHSRTPSSCIPSTPCEDRFGGGGDSSRSSTYATIDGLHNVSDEVTKRLHQILLHHQSEKESLKRDLQATRQALYNQIQHNRCHNHHHDGTEDQMSLPESVGSGSGGSVGQESGVSDTSWEAVEEGEARPTLWVPDHAVDSCTGCNTQFWIGRRKHHCRSCGKIFCSNCSEHSIPIPREQLYQPVRVCGACFYNLGVEHTKPKIVAAASN